MIDGTADAPVNCPVCEHQMARRIPAWWYVCRDCGMEISTLEPLFDERPMTEIFDWDQRRAGLETIRNVNFQRLLDHLATILQPPAKLLDVGCAEGLFLKSAAKRGYNVEGLEADARMAGRPDDDIAVRHGLFPDALAPDEKFDIITFNDVFEHLPDVGGALAACSHHLTDRGVLILNIPNAEGGIYRLSKLLARSGVRGPFRRMWQADYPSPHLSYFTPGTLNQLAQSHGFKERLRRELPAIQISGTWARIRCDRTRPWLYSAAAWLGVLGALPILYALPSDINLQMFDKDGA